jgi:hypothetical protein
VIVTSDKDQIELQMTFEDEDDKYFQIRGAAIRLFHEGKVPICVGVIAEVWIGTEGSTIPPWQDPMRKEGVVVAFMTEDDRCKVAGRSVSRDENENLISVQWDFETPSSKGEYPLLQEFFDSYKEASGAIPQRGGERILLLVDEGDGSFNLPFNF